MSEIVAPRTELTEEDRLAVLQSLGALDSDSDPRFDRLVRLAAALFQAPRASVVLVDRDRLWHKASIGIPRRNYARAGALADRMIERAETLASPDITCDPRFSGFLDQLTQVDVRFFACAPLKTTEGAVIGLLAVGDPAAHPPATPVQLAALSDLADLAMDKLMNDARRLANERGQRLDRQRRDLALKAGGLGEFEWDLARDRMEISEDMRSLTGVKVLSLAADQGDAPFRFVHPDDRESLRASIEQSVRENDRYLAEYRIIRPDNGEIRWMMGAGALVRDGSGAPQKLIGVVQDISGRKQVEAQRETLMAELDHRVKNLLAAVQSLAAQSARKARSLEDFLPAFSGRLQALAQAHQLLTETRWQGASLTSIVAAELGGLGRSQASWCGPDLFLTPRAANALSLALHELATNAIKYGALSCEEGRVHVLWRPSEQGGFDLDWVETGGPLVEKPTRQGFGTVLLERVTARELGGMGQIDFAPEGVRAHLRADRSALGAAVPETDGAAQRPMAPSPPDPVLHGAGIEGLRLLVVEDSTLLALELESGLAEAGALVVGATGDPDEALALAEADLDAAVLDVNLGGRRVTPVAERLAARGIPFVFATGYGEQGAPQGFGAPVIRKPYSIQQIIRALADLVGPPSDDPVGPKP